jgi:hypothetical protein
MWLLMIVLHAAAALGAFAVGAAAIDPGRAGNHRWMLAALVGPAPGHFRVHGRGHGGALVGPARRLPGRVQCVGRARPLHGVPRSARRGPRRPRPLRPRARHLDDLGFILIALFDGFVIVAAVDLGAPVWLVTPLALLAVQVGHRAVQRYKSRVATPPPTTTGT